MLIFLLDESEFNTSNDFRRIALLRNPTDSTTGSTQLRQHLTQLKSITFSGTMSSFNDEKITQASTVLFVVEILILLQKF